MIALPKHVHAVTKSTKNGERTYFYFAPKRGTGAASGRARLPDDPGSFAFWQRYSELAGTVNPMESAPSAGSVAALIASYQASPEFEKRKPRTRDEYLRHMETIAGIWGARSVRSLQPKHILALRDSFADTPTKADHIISMMSTLCTFGKFRGFCDSNPCQGLPDLADSDGYPPWEWTDIEYARGALPPYLWWPCAVALYSGQRLSDCLAMNWSAIAGDEIDVRQGKTNKLMRLVLHRELRAILDTIPKRSVRILTNSRGLPWASGFKATWQHAMNRPAFAGFRARRLTFHGLRKSSVCMLLEAGCSDAEVSAVTGQSRKMVEHYSIMVNQRKLNRNAILKWERNMPGL